MEYLRGQVYWANNPFAHGSVQGFSSSTKGRPYLIISNNNCNKHSPTITVIPFTTKRKKYLPTHHALRINNILNVAMTEQITCIDKTDIGEYITTLSDKDLKIIEEKIKIQLGLKGE